METEYIEGFSKSAWKSLAVKALRLGWVQGLERACCNLGKSEMKPILICGLFEDTFPAINELPQVLEEVRRLDFVALCERETHHGRGLTPRFCELAPEAKAAAQNKVGELFDAGKRHNIWLSKRALNVWWTWLEMAPLDTGRKRIPDMTEWSGMPRAVVDAHTFEGKVADVGATILSGHYHKHLELSQHVEAHGWEWVREQVHSGPKFASRQPNFTPDLFANV